MPELSEKQIERFVSDGYVRLDGAFPRNLADECRDILWRETGCDPHDRSTWQRPVVWSWFHSEPPFRAAANTPALLAAYDQLVGAGRWQPMPGLGTFPIRFPAEADTGDTGWHIDASFAGAETDPDDFMSWRVNVHSRARALLTLFLFSDVGENDAPTRIRVGSHLKVASMLAPAGENGLIASRLDFSATADCAEVTATGEAGTVYLCHPFLVHAAQVNRGNAPRFIAQPPLYSTVPCQLQRDDGAYSPVEIAIRRGLQSP